MLKEHLRRHVARRAAEGERVARCMLRLQAQDLGVAKVHKLDVPVGAEEEVVERQVAVQYVKRVQVFQRAGGAAGVEPDGC